MLKNVKLTQGLKNKKLSKMKLTDLESNARQNVRGEK